MFYLTELNESNQALFINLLLVFTIGNAPGQTHDTLKLSNRVYTILFVGNSLTYINNMPLLVKNKAKLQGIKLNTTILANPNYALIDHWNDGKVQKLISLKKYDFVIVQQGPSSQKEGRQLLLEYAEKFSQLCKNHNSKLVLFMVWPALDSFHTFGSVIKNYREAATKNNSILCPVGKVWKAYIENTNNFDYYSFDNFHPSLKGSQVVADIIVQHLFNLVWY
ncbi:MAG: SGNH/GDSL hydrolase family protein [Aureibaculum sp.]